MKIINKINNFLYKNKLIIFLGKKGIKITAYSKHKAVSSIFIEYHSPDRAKQYQDFLKSYKKFQVLILLDSAECQLKHEFMPMLQSIIKFNPVEKFIEDNYKSEDIIAYNIYNIDYTNGEVWESIIAISPYTDTIQELLEFIIYNSFSFIGMYFLSLEFESVVNAILTEDENEGHGNDLQIFVTFMEASGIRVVTKHKKNILEELTAEFPFNKSDLYIIGTIEQIISDQVLKYKEYVKSLELKICLIFLCNQVLIDFFTQSTSLKDYKIIAYSDEYLIASNKDQTNHFQDDILLELCIKHKKHLALNKLLKSITKLTYLNSIIFKPLMIIIFGILVIISTLKYKAVIIQQQTNELNDKYYLFSEKYRTIKKKHPEAENISNLAELYNLQTIVDKKLPAPANFLKQLYSIHNANIEIINTSWYIEESQEIDKKILITLEILYTSNKKDMQAALDILNKYIEEIRNVFKDYKVEYSVEYEENIELLKQLIIPAKIIISRTMEGGVNAR